ncbi:MAG: hypothetical protein MJD61_07720 [Proteobacteria bacterium]|nr:hypothetical protein [Pseudomonadota bacterium]
MPSCSGGGFARWLGVALAALGALSSCPEAAAQQASTLVRFEFVPTKRAQIAIWIESAEGEFLRTVWLTEAVARRGIGNRPGASQMNSGWRWPYGRREGVLPVWAHARAQAPGAQSFPRVIFQDRRNAGGVPAEGYASRSSNDFSPDDYFCLSFNAELSRHDQLDAITCASQFNSDKGRYLTSLDVGSGYGEPYEASRGAGTMRPLSLSSLYPARSDVRRCAATSCFDHQDVARFASDVRQVMPEIDAVTHATQPGDELVDYTWPFPLDLAPGDYVAWLEINVEGDYGAGSTAFGPDALPTPSTPQDSWDSWALTFGYPYRGQPSVVYALPFETYSGRETTFQTKEAAGRGTWDSTAPGFGEINQSMLGIRDNPALAPGSGADRLRAMSDGSRFKIGVSGGCKSDRAPGAIQDLSVLRHGNEKHSHQWAHLSFTAPEDDVQIARYEVRVGTEPISDETSFLRALPAKSASSEMDALKIPVAGEEPTISIDFGGLAPETRYYVGIRAVDSCASAGPIAVAEVTTSEIHFTTVSPCFVASAAFGTPLAEEVFVLRRFRDRYLMPYAAGRYLVDLYYRHGPVAARAIRHNETLRGFTRQLLSPLIWLARALDNED